MVLSKTKDKTNPSLESVVTELSFNFPKTKRGTPRFTGVHLPCPDCGSPMSEKQPSETWLGYWECLDCFKAFHFVRVNGRTYLERGRTPA